MKKLVILLVLGIGVFAFYFFDIAQLLTLNSLKSGVTELQAYVGQHFLLSIAAFFFAYVCITGMSLPGAAIMTLAAGAMFGLFWGTVIVSFASTVGATCAFLVSRYLLQDSVNKKFGNKLKALNEGLEKDGAFYLFSLRLVPYFPFFIINLLIGLTKIRTWTFYWVSQLGMLLGTFIYVNAGTQLSQIESFKDIATPSLLISFTLLATFPLIAKFALSKIQDRRIYKRWSKPKSFDRNLIVIGAGAGGLVSAYIGATVKAEVTLVEASKMGGDCLNYGCVPSKALIKTAKLYHKLQNTEKYGIAWLEGKEVSNKEAITNGIPTTLSCKAIFERINHIIKAIEPHDSVERYSAMGVDVVKGYAKIITPWQVEISKDNGDVQQLTTKNIIVATGASPFVPDIPGLADINYMTSDSMWDQLSKREELPKRLLVLGGGPIGCELSQAFARLGCKVIQVEMAARLMQREDQEVSNFVRSSLENNGVQVLVNHKAIRFEKQGNEQSIILSHNEQEVRIEFDDLLCAVGREARLQGFGLEALGIQCNKVLPTNDYLQTQYPNIFAVGDVAGPYQFTHTAAHQAWYAAVNAMFGTFKKFKVDYRVIPWTTFLDPEVARVGINEQEAKEQGIDYEVTRYGIDDLDRAICESEAQGFVKVLTLKGKDSILGVTIVASGAGDLLAEFVLAMKHGLSLNKILGTIHAYPTWAEANKFAAGEWKKAHAPTTILALLKKYHAWCRK